LSRPARLGLDVFPDGLPDHDADVVVRSRDGRKYFDIQVRTLRRWSNYLFITDDEFPQKANAYLVLVLLPEESEPKYCLLPQSAWGEGIRSTSSTTTTSGARVGPSTGSG